MEIEIPSDHPAVNLRLPADADSLPVARHAVRSLGEALDADARPLAHAERAVTDACADAIGRAGPLDGGGLELRLRPHGRRLRAAVHPGDAPTMLLGLRTRGADGAAPRGHPGAVARVVRRVTAVFAARVDPPSDRLVEALFLSEIVVRLAPRRVTGGRLVLGLDSREGGLCMRIGPLVCGGADGLLGDAALPGVGSVIERLADRVSVEPAAGLPGARAERLVVAIGAPSAA